MELDYMPDEYRDFELDFWCRARGLRRLVHHDTQAAVEWLKRVLHHRTRILGIVIEGVLVRVVKEKGRGVLNSWLYNDLHDWFERGGDTRLVWSVSQTAG